MLTNTGGASSPFPASSQPTPEDGNFDEAFAELNQTFIESGISWLGDRLKPPTTDRGGATDIPVERIQAALDTAPAQEVFALKTRLQNIAAWTVEPFTAQHLAYAAAGGKDRRNTSAAGKQVTSNVQDFVNQYAGNFALVGDGPIRTTTSDLTTHARNFIDDVVETNKEIVRSTISGGVEGGRASASGARTGARLGGGAAMTQNIALIAGLGILGLLVLRK